MILEDKRLLYITDCYYTDASGSRNSARLHLKTLESIFKTVDVVALVGPGAVGDVEEKHIVIEGEKNKLFLFCNCILGYPTYLDFKICKLIIQMLRENKFDVVFVDNSILGILIKKIKMEFPKTLVITYYHDVKASLARTWLKRAGLIKKPVYMAMLKNEKLTSIYSDCNLVLNNREEQLFIKYYHKRPEGLLPVYLDVELNRHTYSNGGFNILFFGGGYGPNIRGIRWFVNNVFNKLDFDASLIIAGRDMDIHCGDLANEKIHVLGFVDSIKAVYDKADVVISPIFDGGGMKVKVAEAMGFGKIIVGTDESFVGYDSNIPNELWNKYFFRANDETEFVESLTNIFENGEYKHFIDESRAIYEKHYSKESAKKMIEKIISEYYVQYNETNKRTINYDNH